MKRLLRYIAVALLGLVLLLALGWWWLTSTSSGASWVLGQAKSRVESLTWAELDGGISPGLTLRDVRFEQAGLRVAAERLELAVSIGLLPLDVTVGHLRLTGTSIHLPASEESDAPAEPFEPGDYTAPVPVRVDELTVDGLAIHTGPDAEPLMIQRIELAADYGESLAIDELAVRSDPYTLTANGRLGLSAPWSADLETGVDWRLDPSGTQRLDLDIDGALESLRLGIAGEGPLTVDGRAELDGLPDLDAFDASIEIAGGLSEWPGLAGSLENVRLAAEGAPSDWSAEVDGRVRWPEQPVVDVSIAAAGSTRAVEITRGDFALLDGAVRMTGRADLSDPTTAQAEVRLENLDFTPLYPEWPAQAALSGGFDAAWDGSVLEIADLGLRAPPAPLRVSGGGRFAVDDRSLDVALEWESLVWPPVVDESEPLISSESGRLDASGTLEEWRAELEAWLQAPDQPRARLELEATGDASEATVTGGRLDFGEAGRVELSGRVGYAPELTAALGLEIAGLNPGALVPQLPGRVDGDLSLDFDGAAPLSLGLEVQRLDGTLRGQPLAGGGALRIVENRVERADIELSLGDNRTRLATDGDESWQVELTAERLGQLWPGLSGALSAEGAFDPADRSVRWTLESDGLGWSGRRLASMTGRGTANWGDAPSVDAALEATDVDLNPWERLEQVTVTLGGNCRAHTLTTAIVGTRANMDFALTGHLPGCLEADRGWSGVVRRLTFSDTPLGQWQLDQNLAVHVRDGTVSADAACLWTPEGSGRLCLNALRVGADGEAALAFNSVPVDLLLFPTDPVFTLGSRLRGAAGLRWNADGVQSVDAEIRMGPGAARMLGEDEDLLTIRGGRLSLSSPQAQALDALLELRVESQSEFVAEASIPSLADPADMRLDATANLSLPNLAALNRLAPQLDELGGRLEGNFVLAGPLDSLDFDGRVAIRDGRFFYAPLGSRVEQMDIVLEGDETGGSLTGGFSAGDGTAELAGHLDLDDPGPRARLSLNGERLELFDVDWLEMTASSDLEIAWLPERIELGGNLAIDRARLGLPPGSAERVSASPDVVVAGRAQPQEEVEEAPPRDIVGSVSLSLGDDVRLVAAGMETNITGQLDLEWEEGRAMPEGRGSLNLVDGSYSAYGQNLEVTEGEVLFTGRPVDNPVLQIAAVRDIFGDPRVEQAGVRILGPARNPEITLFTDPPTSREKALAYILTGAEFDHAAGQGAFSVGFWVLPELFVSYGVGLFDTGNVLAARYELSRRWGLRATSGERDTGLDVSFIIDR